MIARHSALKLVALISAHTHRQCAISFSFQDMCVCSSTGWCVCNSVLWQMRGAQGTHTSLAQCCGNQLQRISSGCWFPATGRALQACTHLCLYLADSFVACLCPFLRLTVPLPFSQLLSLISIPQTHPYPASGTQAQQLSSPTPGGRC